MRSVVFKRVSRLEAGFKTAQGAVDHFYPS